MARPPRSKGRRGRPGTARRLHPDPDRVVEIRAESCPHCAAGLADTDQTVQAVYDRIELPPIKPVINRVRLYGGSCQPAILALHR